MFIDEGFTRFRWIAEQFCRCLSEAGYALSAQYFKYRQPDRFRSAKLTMVNIPDVQVNFSCQVMTLRPWTVPTRIPGKNLVTAELVWAVPIQILNQQRYFI